MTFKHKELTKACQGYIEYLDKQSPIISTSHHYLRGLYDTWGKDNIDKELVRLFKERADK